MLERLLIAALGVLYLVITIVVVFTVAGLVYGFLQNPLAFIGAQ